MNLREMNLQIVGGTPFNVMCVKCRKMCGPSYRHDARIFADINGKAFEAYYCGPCGDELRRLESKDES